MYEPERPLEPPEPALAGACEFCGADIYVGDEVYEIPDENFPGLTCVTCEDCILDWLGKHKVIAGGQRNG